MDTQEAENDPRYERGQRILDTAAALILRWGYGKTTIDDVARQAGVAKGTIYLHWKTREDLFLALMQRERLALVEDVQRRIAIDPAGANMRSMFKHSALAIMARPLIKAVLVRDTEVIGKLAHSEHSRELLDERLAGFTAYLELLRSHGLIRTDMSLDQQVYLVSAIFLGFFLVEPILPEQISIGDETRAELMAESIVCALASHAGAVDTSALETRLADSYVQRDLSLAHKYARPNPQE